MMINSVSRSVGALQADKPSKKERLAAKRTFLSRWRWRELNPRPKHSFRDLYRLSRTILCRLADSVQQDSLPDQPVLLR